MAGKKRKATQPPPGPRWDDPEVREEDMGGGGDCLFYCFAAAISAGLTSANEADQAWAGTCQSLVESWYSSNPVLVEMKNSIGREVMPCSAQGLRALVAWFVIYSNEYKAMITRAGFNDPEMRSGGIPPWVKKAGFIRDPSYVAPAVPPGEKPEKAPTVVNLEKLRQVMLNSSSQHGYYADYLALSLLTCLLPITAVVVTLANSTTRISAEDDEQCTFADVEHPVIVLHNVRLGGHEHYVMYTLSGVPYMWETAEVARILNAVNSSGRDKVLKLL